MSSKRIVLCTPAALACFGLTLLLPGPAQAEVVLQVVNPDTSGVIAFTPGSPLVFRSDANNPTLAVATAGLNQVSASLNDAVGPARSFALNLNLNTPSGDSIAAITGDGASSVPITFQIVGTGSEAQGTPVSLVIDGRYGTSDRSGSSAIHNFNGMDLLLNTPVTLDGLAVGDTFGYFAALTSAGNEPIAAAFTSSLTVRSASLGEELIPEPGTLALLGAALPLAGCAGRRRKRTGRG